MAAAAEKLAECQETIFLLGKQLKTLRPQSESVASPLNGRSGKGEDLNEEEPTISGSNLQDTDQNEIDTGSSINLQRAGSESPLERNSMFSSSDTEANNLLRSPVSSKPPKHGPTMSGSSSSSSTPTPEKHSRGFSRFFTSKGNSGC